MIRRAEGRQSRKASQGIDLAFREAFLTANREFIVQYGRSPNYDFVVFQGGFSTTECIVELIEEEWE